MTDKKIKDKELDNNNFEDEFEDDFEDTETIGLNFKVIKEYSIGCDIPADSSEKEQKEIINNVISDIIENDNNSEDKYIEFINDENGICPICCNRNLTYSTPIIDGETLIYPWICDDCKATGKEVYNLTFIENINVKERSE